MQDKEKKENENIDFSDGISFKEARFAFGIFAAVVTLLFALLIYVIEGDVTGRLVELTLGFASILILGRCFNR